MGYSIRVVSANLTDTAKQMFEVGESIDLCFVEPVTNEPLVTEVETLGQWGPDWEVRAVFENVCGSNGEHCYHILNAKRIHSVIYGCRTARKMDSLISATVISTMEKALSVLRTEQFVCVTWG